MKRQTNPIYKIVSGVSSAFFLFFLLDVAFFSFSFLNDAISAQTNNYRGFVLKVLVIFYTNLNKVLSIVFTT